MIEVNDGIFIDYGCSGIVPIRKGVFIPTGCRASDSEKKFQEDLSTFLNKWFGGGVLGESGEASDSSF